MTSHQASIDVDGHPNIYRPPSMSFFQLDSFTHFGIRNSHREIIAILQMYRIFAANIMDPPYSIKRTTAWMLIGIGFIVAVVRSAPASIDSEALCPDRSQPECSHFCMEACITRCHDFDNGTLHFLDKSECYTDDCLDCLIPHCCVTTKQLLVFLRFGKR